MRESELDSAIAGSLGELAREHVARRDPVPDEARVRLLLALESQRRPTKKLWLAIPALATAAAALLFVLWPRPLSYEVAGRVPPGSYVSAPEDRSVSLRFSDASEIEVGKGSQLRVAETTPLGARVLLERGSLAVNVTHRRSTEWTFVAGPCEVRVVGTRFALAWDPRHQVFELRLDAGAVEVQTPLSSTRVALRAGQEFRADLTKRSMLTTEVGPSAGVEPPTATELAIAPTAQRDAEESAEVPSVRSASPQLEARATRSSWRKLIAEGRFRDVLTEAEGRGIARCLGSSSASDLGALADAARYTGKSNVAEQALLALRSRFPADAEGRSAAFMLGRLHEERGNAAVAKGFYDRYLSEAPNGTYVPEALAGTMRTTQATAGREAAAGAATEYLKRYPKGVHAKTARAILGTP